MQVGDKVVIGCPQPSVDGIIWVASLIGIDVLTEILLIDEALPADGAHVGLPFENVLLYSFAELEAPLLAMIPQPNSTRAIFGGTD